MSRMNQLKSLAKEAKQKGDREKYEQIRGDIFREFDFDIGKFAKGGGVVARGCGAIMANRRKVTKGSVSKV